MYDGFDASAGDHRDEREEQQRIEQDPYETKPIRHSGSIVVLSAHLFSPTIITVFNGVVKS